MSVWVSSLASRLVDAGRGLLTGVVGAVVGVARGLRVVLAGIMGGVALYARGRPREGRFQLRRGLFRVVQLPVDVFLMLAGRVVSAVQVLLWMEPVGRRLSGFEVELLRPLFGASVDYAAVRLKEGPLGILGMSGRAFAHGDTVFVPPGGGPTDLGLLVHELVHVWQHQHGGTAYMSSAIVAQLSGDGYNWRKGVERGLRWEELNPEQQAQFIEEAALVGLIHPDHRALSPRARLKGWTEKALPLLEEAIVSVRTGRGAP